MIPHLPIHPTTLERLGRFRRNRRAFWSLVLITTLFVTSLFAEALCNNRPLALRYQGRWYFPLFRYYPAATFGDEVSSEPDYKVVARTQGAWALFPPVPHGPNESMANLSGPPPTPPTRDNWLGTDDRGRDLLTRLVYGFRSSLLFALASWLAIVVVAYVLGSVQGYYGGRIDFFGQRLTEIWHALPVLYVIIFLLSILPASLVLLALVWVSFSWIPIAAYVRAEVLRIRKQEFVTAARALGAGTPRLLFRHVLPNALTPILTFSPFILSASIASLAALDYLGLGLPPPTASWGELLREGKENLTSWWLAFFPFFSLFFTLLLFNFVGEGMREAFDSRASRATSHR